MDFRLLPMRKSPFHDDSLANSKSDKRPTIRIPSEAYERLNNYFEANNLDFSKGIRSLCYDKLDTICNERKTFNNLEVFMLIPKIKIDNIDLDDMESAVNLYYNILNTTSQIIAIVNTECDFREDFNHVRRFEDDYNLSYEMKEFNAENFPMNILRNTKDSCVYRTNKKDLNSFYTFKDCQSQLYDDNRFSTMEDMFSLGVDDCYFVHFPLNNYLDEFRNGQFQQKDFSNSHEGVYVFEARNGLFKHYCFINWDYSKENDNISFELYFSDSEFFLDEVYKTKDEKLIYSALGVINGDNRRKRLEEYKQRLSDEIDYVNHLLEKSIDD